MHTNGKCIIVSAPSGAGKTTLVKHLLETEATLEFSVSACSRPQREGETHGKDYYFLTPEQFREKIDMNEFVEWEEVYPGSYYGTLKSELNRIWSKGKHVIFDVDVYGGINLKKIFGDVAYSIFIAPPSVEILEQRLVSRGTDPEESIRQRLAKAREELELQSHFDYVIINDHLPTAQSEIYTQIHTFLNPSIPN
jgi:guanylate kinase